MNEHERIVIATAISQMETLVRQMREILSGNGTDAHIITDIEKYVSNSGNTTWKCYNAMGDIVAYIRQAHREFWEQLGHWDSLNRLDENAVYGCDIHLSTYREGDFNRIVSVQKFVIRIDSADKEPF